MALPFCFFQIYAWLRFYLALQIVLIYFRPNRDLNQLVCPCMPKGSWMKWKVILPVGKLLIFVQLAMAAWKDLKVFWQLNNVNFRPINILLQFRPRRIFSTVIKRREQHLSSGEEAVLDFHPWKSPTAKRDPTTGDIWNRKTVTELYFVLSCTNICLHVMLYSC